MNINRIVTVGVTAFAAMVTFAATPTITDVTAQQRYPWNGLVDIDVTFSAVGLSTVSFEVKDTVGNTNLNAQTIYVGEPSNNNRTLEVQPGTRRFVWDAAADLGTVTIPSFTVKATVREKIFQVNVTGGTGSGSFVQGSAASLVAASKTGYTFTGWSGTTADTGLLASATSASTTLTVPSRDVAYEATYTPNTYTVKFNANGGTGTMADESFTYDVSKALTANAFTRTDYTFKGWAESASATTAKYTDGQSVKNLAASGTKNLYAVWEIIFIRLWANGPYWAKYNVGATKPEETGYYFWWGDTVGYKWQNSKWVASDGSVSGYNFKGANCPTYGKTTTQLRNQGWLDSNGYLVPAHDAARVHWGGNWRMPTRSELNSLISRCTWTLTTTNSVKGYIVCGKDSYASSKIFIPFTGYGHGTSFTEATTLGDYWSSYASSNYDNETAWSLFVDSGTQNTSDHRLQINGRQNGLVIRPVKSAGQ